MDEYHPDPRLVVAASFPRCGAPAAAGTGAVSIGACGHQWNLGPAEVLRRPAAPPASPPVADVEADDPGTSGFRTERIRRYLLGG